MSMLLVKLLFPIQVLQGLVIGVDDELLWPKIILPMLQTLYQSIQLLVVGHYKSLGLYRWLSPTNMVFVRNFDENKRMTGDF